MGFLRNANKHFGKLNVIAENLDAENDGCSLSLRLF